MKKAFFALFIIFSTNLPSIYYGWYIKLPWFDMVQHYLGGFFMAMFMFYYLKDHMKDGFYFKNALIVVGATATIGILWELAEYFANQVLIEPTYKYFGIKAYFMGDMRDTMTDLFLDMFGALSFYTLHFLRSRNTHQIETNS